MFETERLLLRKFNENDIDAIFELRRDPEMMRFIREPQKKREESENWVRLVSSRWDKEKIGFCAVIDKASTQLIGWCGLWRLLETNEIEVGYAIAKNVWTKGYASEAAQVLLTYG